MADSTDPTVPSPGYDPYGQTRKLSELTGDLPKRAARTWRRVLWGCGCGCISFLLLLLVGVLAFWVWASDMKTPLSAELAWQSGDAADYAVHLHTGNPATLEILRKLADRIDREPPDPIAPPVRTIFSHLGRKSTREILEALVPIEIGYGFPEPPPTMAGNPNFFVSLSRYGNLFSYLGRKDLEGKLEAGRSSFVHEEVDVLPVSGGTRAPFWAAFTQHSILAAEGEDAIRAMVGRARAGKADLGDLGEYRAKIEGTPDLYGVWINRGKWFVPARNWGANSDEFTRRLDAALGAAFGLDLVTSDAVHATVWVRMPDAKAAADFASLLHDHREKLLEKLSTDSGGRITGEVHAEAEWVRVRLEAGDCERQIQDTILKLLR